MIRLGLHCHAVAKELDDKIYMIGHFGRFVDSLAACCDYLYVFLHEEDKNEKAITDYCLTANNVKWVNIGPHSSVPKRVINSYKVKRIIRQWRSKLDCMLIRGPSPLLPEVARACGALPIVLLFGADTLAGIDGLPQPFWRKELIRAFWKWNYQRQLSVAKRSLTFVNSELMYQQLQGKVANLVETRTTTLLQDEFNYRDDTCQKRPIHLLYTGRMDRTKGLLDILEAVNILVNDGEDLFFDLVGPPEKNDAIVEELKKLASIYGLSERIVFHGFQSLGPALLSFYRQADIYVIASQASEGFPRTIWEAFSQGTPVIATSVGSIPYYLENEKNALIAPPKSPSELARLIKRLIYEPDLRMRLIANGYKLAEENTLDRRAKEMITEIEKWLGHETNT